MNLPPSLVKILMFFTPAPSNGDFLEKIRNGVELGLFLGLTLGLYLLMALTLPFFQQTHGILVMTEWADISRSASIHTFLFASAAVCVILGTLLLEWIPSLTPGLMANLWSVTYFFIWIDAVFSLCVQSQSMRYLWSLGLGILFIYIFFLILQLQDQGPAHSSPAEWKPKIVSQWFWGWMGFYFGLSCLMAYDSLWFLPSRMALAFGAMALCFFNYLLCLLLKKGEGAGFSLTGRRFFTAWFTILTLVWVAERFFGL
jgi:hypothetical protein